MGDGVIYMVVVGILNLVVVSSYGGMRLMGMKRRV